MSRRVHVVEPTHVNSQRDLAVDLGRIVHRVGSSELQWQRRCVAKLLKRLDQGFPGSFPTTLSRRELGQLDPHDFRLLAKSDGLRYLLYLGTERSDGGMLPVQYLISRKNEYHRLQSAPFQVKRGKESQSHSRDWHRGSIFDGEITREIDAQGCPRAAFWVFDCLAVDGEAITGLDYDFRLEIVKDQFFNHIQPAAPQDDGGARTPLLTMAIKEMYSAEQVSKLWDVIIPTLPYKVDGMILMPKKVSYVSGTDYRVLKWKPPTGNTVDFVLAILRGDDVSKPPGEARGDKEASGSIDLLVHTGNGRHEKYAPLTLTDQERETLGPIRGDLDGKIMECFYGTDAQWHPKFHESGLPIFRDDKTCANFITVAQEIQDVSRQPITRDELCTALQRVAPLAKGTKATLRQPI